MSDTFRTFVDTFSFGDLDRESRVSLDSDAQDSGFAAPVTLAATATDAEEAAVQSADGSATTQTFELAPSAAPLRAEIVDPTFAPQPPSAGVGTISLTTAGVAVAENFDSLSNTAGSTTNTALPIGWFTTETGGGARDNEQYAVDTGASNTADTYSYGSAGSTDRALGGLQSGTLIPVIGAAFTNTTGQTLSSLLIAFTGEQWRLGALGRTDRLDFQISFDATSLATGTWFDINTLDFTAPVTAGTVGALDGNAAANRTAISATISSADIPGLSIANGATFWIRFNDFNATTSDDGLAIDNFSITGVAGAASPGSLAINDITLSEGNSGTTNFTFTVTRSGGTAGAVSATWTLANGTTDNADFTASPQTGSVDFLDGETSKTITITVAGDTAVEGSDIFFVNLTNPTGGVTITDGQGLGMIANDDTPPVGTLSIDDVSLAEGNSGTTNMVFTVTRSGGSTGAGDVTWTVSNGTTNAADFSGALTGTVSFADGQTSATITVGVAGDTVAESNENYTVTLSNPTGGLTITDASGTGTITNDDVAPIANVWINEIHYDNASTDANEFVEVAGLAGVDLTGWSIVLYNGNGGASYSTINLSGTLASSTNGFGFVKALTPGIQNGPPDGIALVDNLGRVVQFLSYEGVMTATSGPANGLTSTDIGVSQDNATVGLTLQLVGTGSSYADFTWAANVANTEGAVNAGQSFLSGTDQGQISIRDASVTEGNSGTSTVTFTVSRAGGFATSATVDYTVALDATANAADFDAGAVFTGTLTFAAGEFSCTITLPVQGDTSGEGNETFSVNLSNVTGNAAIADGAATGTIINDDPVTLTIMQIQGAGHTSAYVGQPVTTSGIVTAVATNGYYLQDPTGDGNAATSDAMFVFTSTAPTVAVGDNVSVTGAVAEFAANGGLSVTQLNPTATTINSSGNALPTAVLIGTGGLLPPTTVIDNDSFGTYDPATDGIDFWESLEGMRVTLDAPRAVSNTNSFGETDVIVSGGTGATGANARGGITISGTGGGDFNPEKIQIDDTFGALIGYTPGHSIGDVLASVTGVVNYSFLNYEVLATSAVTVTQDVTLTDEQTALQGDVNYVTIATYNVENMDPSDNKYTILAHDIIYSLSAPDIVALQEVQDADGAGTGSDLSGVSNVQGLIDAIFAASGIVYTYVEIAPTVANSTGGEPNGNIRNGYLYQADRVSLISGSLALLTDSAFNGSRKPLVATWQFQGELFTTINVHFTSRGGSDALWGATQPPSNAGDAARTAQAAAVGAYVNSNLATDPSLNYMILGDFNGFYFEAAQTQLTSGGVFTNLAESLLAAEERYSYVFESNSQLIDNILVTGGLLTGAGIDAVHLNAEFTGTRPTDHDPQIARLLLGTAPSDLAIDDANVDENLVAGTVVGTLSASDAPGDTLTYSLTDDAGGRFTVNSSTGAVSTTAALNFETGASYSITARVVDAAGQASTRTVTINVGDVNEAPTAAADAFNVNEDADSANLWSVLLGNDSDPDAGTTLTITAVNTTGTRGTVTFNAATQTLIYAADANAFDELDAGEVLTDTFTYTISDGTFTRTATANVTVDGITEVVVTTPGTNNSETINGGDGEDELFGLGGSDILNGGRGHDWLVGGQRNDTLIGGEGRDTFVFNYGDKHDVIVDFSKTDDRLVIGGGGTIGQATVSDFNNDGILDLRIKLFWDGWLGGSVILLGVDSIAGVRVDYITTPTPPSQSGGWVDWSQPPPSQRVITDKFVDFSVSDGGAIPVYADLMNALSNDYLMLV